MKYFQETEDTLYVSREVAVKIGLKEAIVLTRIANWVHTEGQEKDGQKWICMTTKNMQDDFFSFWSINTINTKIRRLKKLGLIDITTRFNETKFDKVRWFALTKAGLDMFIE